MSKAVLVIEEPNSCDECICVEEVGCRRYYCEALCEYIENLEKRKHSTVPKVCPLKELPKEDNDFSGDEFEDGFTFGWNACLREIMGEQNDG